MAVYRSTTDTQIKRPWWFLLTATIWDPSAVVVLSYVALITAIGGTPAGVGYALLLGFVYFFAVVGTSPAIRDSKYPLYLASKGARVATKWQRGWQYQWYTKFERHFRRSFNRLLPKGEKDLFVCIEARRLSLARKEPMTVRQAPGPRALFRASYQARSRAALLTAQESRRNVVAARMNRFVQRVKDSSNPIDAHINFLLDDYFSFEEGERKFMLKYKEETWWDRHPTALKALTNVAAYAVAAAVGVFVLHVLGVPLPGG